MLKLIPGHVHDKDLKSDVDCLDSREEQEAIRRMPIYAREWICNGRRRDIEPDHRHPLLDGRLTE